MFLLGNAAKTSSFIIGFASCDAYNMGTEAFRTSI